MINWKECRANSFYEIKRMFINLLGIQWGKIRQASLSLRRSIISLGSSRAGEEMFPRSSSKNASLVATSMPGTACRTSRTFQLHNLEKLRRNRTSTQPNTTSKTWRCKPIDDTMCKSLSASGTWSWAFQSHPKGFGSLATVQTIVQAPKLKLSKLKWRWWKISFHLASALS